MGQLCCQPEDPNAPADRPQAKFNVPHGPVRRKVHGPAAIDDATPPSGVANADYVAYLSAAPTGTIAAALAGAIAAAVVCAAGNDPTPPTSPPTSPPAGAAPIMGASPAEGASEGLRPALAEVTDNRPGQRLPEKCPGYGSAAEAPSSAEQDGRQQPLAGPSPPAPQHVELSMPAPIPAMGPAEGTPGAAHRALLDVTNYHAARGQLADKCSDATPVAPSAPSPAAGPAGPEDEEVWLRPSVHSAHSAPPLGEAPRPVPAPAAAPSPPGAMEEDGGEIEEDGGEMEEDDGGHFPRVAGRSSGARMPRGGPFSGAGGEPCGTPRREPQQTRLDLVVLRDDEPIALGHYAPARQRAARPPAAMQPEQSPAPVQPEQPPAAGQVLHAGHLEAGLLREDAELPDSFFNVPMQRPAAAAIDLRPAASRSRAPAAAPAAQTPCAAPPRPSTPSSSRGGCAALDYGPEGHLRVSAGKWVTARNGDQVRVTAFLGSGSFAAVWRCSKLGGSGVFALKICRSGANNTKCARREALALKRVHERNPLLRCYAARVLKLLFTLEVDGPHGMIHYCIAVPQMGADVATLLAAHGGQGVALSLAKILTKQTLQGLAYLAAAGYALSDLKPANLLLGPPCRAGAPASGGAAGGDELLRGQYCPPRQGEGLEPALMRQYPLCIGDLGGSVDTRLQRPRQRLELTTSYRAPEVVTGAPQVTPAIGIWACACTTFELVTGGLMFCPGRQETDLATDQVHWFRWYVTLGTPPSMYARPERFDYARHFFTAQGRLRYCPRARGCCVATRLEGCIEQEDAAQVADFLMPMLRYDPDERATPREMLRHSWLNF
eukprot:TRINITY_DN17719_c0_g1_i3.p1 TRINITY_DN17719_c0_g1~~TRINITY_DN17719_c0_g1_i3.p1  ORF type:complete len:832 (+),score=165.36 TRINITY_DN17719_c0_g1_i3:113-2608(+)